MRAHRFSGRILASLLTAGVVATSVVALASPAQAATATLTPDTQTIASGQTSEVFYTGDSNLTMEYFLDGQPAGTSAAADALSSSTAPGDLVIPWDWFGGRSTTTLTIRVYDTPFVLGNPDPLYTDTYLASSDIVFSGTNAPLSVAAPGLGTMTQNAAYTHTTDFSTLASGFDFTGGGSIDITGLPAGITATVNNAATPGTNTTATGAPIVSFSGTPTTVGSNTVTYTLSDSLGGSASVSETVNVVAPAPPAATLRAPAFGTMQVGVPYSLSINLATLARNFDWTNGGMASFAPLPAGLSVSMTNADPANPGYSLAGQAPQLLISGTPLTAGAGNAFLAASDAVAGSSNVSVPYVVSAASSASAAPTAINPGQSSTVSWATAWPVTLAEVFYNGTSVASYNIAARQVSVALPYATFAGVGDVYSQRLLSVHLYNANQYTRGNPLPSSTDAYDASTSVILNPTLPTLTPATAAISVNQSTTVNYVGPTTRLYGEYVNGVLVSWGPISDIANQNTGDISISWNGLGGPVSRAFSLRIYNVDAASNPPAFTDAYVAQSTITLNPYVSGASITPITLPQAWVGVPYDQTIDFATQAAGFTWTQGGAALVESLPAGLSWQITNESMPGSSFSVAGAAPIIRIFGTPTAASAGQILIGIGDGQGNSAVASPALTVGTVSVAFNPNIVRVGGSTAISYVGPSGLLACSFLSDVSTTSYSCVDSANIASTMTYAQVAALFGGSLATDTHVVVRVYSDAYSAGATKLLSDTYLATDTATFKATPTITAPSFNSMQVGVPFDQSIDSATFTTNLDWSAGGTVTATGLPDGLTATIPNALMDTIWTGANVTPILRVAGTPTVAGPFTITVTVTDYYGDSVSVPVSVTVAPAATLSAPTFKPMQAGVPFSQSISVGPLSTGFIWSTGASANMSGLPAGLSYSVTTDVNGAPVVLVSGTPTTAGPATITTTATDGRGATASATSNVTVAAAATLTAPSFNAMQVGVPFTQSISVGPLTSGFDWTTGASASLSGLPAGLLYLVSTDANGAPVLSISGTPTTAGPASITTTASDGRGATASAIANVTVAAAASLTAPTFNAMQAGVPFSQSISIASLASGFVWSSGQTTTLSGLPAGLTYSVSTDVNGAPVVLVTGTPSTAGPATITTTVSDGRGATASATSNVTVAAAATLTAPTIAFWRVGTPVTTQVAIGPLSTGFVWANGGSVVVTGLPTGVTYALANPSAGNPLISVAGQAPVVQFSGSPTVAGSFTVSFTAADSRGATASASSSLSVRLATVLPIPTMGFMEQGIPFNQAITVPASAAGWNWHAGGTSSITGLPTGLTYRISNAGTNGWTAAGVIPRIIISGIPRVAGSGNFSWTVTDADGGTATVAVPYTVAPGPIPVDPPAQTIPRPGRVVFNITGIAPGALTIPGPLVPGVTSVTISGSTATLQVASTFSGTIDQTIISSYLGLATTVHLRVTVGVAPVTGATWGPNAGKTIVRWVRSSNATSYRVTLGTKVCTAGATATSCTIAGTYARTTVVNVIAIGATGLTTTTRARWIPVG